MFCDKTFDKKQFDPFIMAKRHSLPVFLFCLGLTFLEAHI